MNEQAEDSGWQAAAQTVRRSLHVNRMNVTEISYKRHLLTGHCKSRTCHLVCRNLIHPALSFTDWTTPRKTYVLHDASELYWAHIANDVDALVCNCRSGAQHRSQVAHKPKLQLSPMAARLEFVVIDILEPLPKPASGN